MALPITAFLCASAFLIQSLAAQICQNANNAFNNGCLGSSLYISNSPCQLSNIAIPNQTGGGFGVSSASPIYPNGVSILSENAFEGNLQVCGQTPFVSAVALNGQLPTVGSSAVNYNCGSNNIGIQSVGNMGGYGGISGLAALGQNSGCGCLY